jgi:heme iron utilization protein
MMAFMRSDDEAWDAGLTARDLVRCGRRAALATADRETGFPYASLVSMATSALGEPLLLLSNLARHTRNVTDDSRVSLLIEEVGVGDPLAAPRVTLLGRLAPDEDADNRRRFLARQTGARGYAGFGDFRVFRLVVESAHLVAGFGRIETLSREAVITDTADASGLLASEEGAAGHMNEDHLDALALYARAFLGEEDGDWRTDGFDPEGMELSLGSRVRYLRFGARVTSSAELRKELVRLAGEARTIVGRTEA